MSQFLRDSVAAGDIIEARPPAGRFTIDAGQSRPAELLPGRQKTNQHGSRTLSVPGRVSCSRTDVCLCEIVALE